MLLVLASSETAAIVAVIPKPNSMTVDEGAPPFVFRSETPILVQDGHGDLLAVAGFLHNLLSVHLPTLAAPSYQGGASVPAGSVLITTAGATAELGPEGYGITGDAGGVTIRAAGRRGAFWAIQTLRQLLPVEVESRVPVTREWTVPQLSITDRPAMGYRGYMLDISRTFFPLRYLKRQIDLMALHKNNVFHLHLSDDQGWRLESFAFPALHEMGSSWDPAAVDQFGDGYLTQQELAALVNYAAARNIEIIPEIDLPAHTLALLHALPSLACNPPRQSSEFPILPWEQWGVASHEPVCPAPESNYVTLDGILGEIADLFPSARLHVGGDEVYDFNTWSASTEVAALRTREGLTSNAQVQAYFTKRIESIVTAHGKSMIAWNEARAASIGLPPALNSLRLDPASITMYWFDGGDNGQMFTSPYILVPPLNFYYDFVGNGMTYPEYSFDPVAFIEARMGRPATSVERANLLGIQGAMWPYREPYRNEETVDQYVYPSHSATSEAAWTDAAARSHADFVSRLAVHQQRLQILSDAYHSQTSVVDAGVTELTFNAATFRPNRVYPFSIAVHNAGTAPLFNQTVRVTAAGAIVFVGDVGEIDAGATSWIEASWDTAGRAPGAYVFEACLEPPPSGDADPFNNCVERTQTITLGEDGLVGQWSFDEGAGLTAFDDSGHGWHGDLDGGVSWIPGRWGTAVAFDGIDGHVATQLATDLPRFTVAMWVRGDSAPSPAPAAGPVHREGNFSVNWNHPSPEFRGAAALKSVGVWYSAGFGTLSPGVWRHLAATFDGESLRAFHDGVLVTETSSPTGPPDPEAGTMTLGRHAVAPQFFRGAVDEVRIFARVLGPDEILSLATVPPGCWPGDPPCDGDGDGRPDAGDNCPGTPNPAQFDDDHDGVGNDCDPDLDGDGLTDATDTDDDGDGVPDHDGDGLVDPCTSGDAVACDDNCPGQRNPGQFDFNGDGQGTACDPNDGVVNAIWFAPIEGTPRLEWLPESGATAYNVHLMTLDLLSATDYGPCQQSGISSTWFTLSDTPPPDAGACYLVTAMLPVGEGGLGPDSAGNPRPNAHPCP